MKDVFFMCFGKSEVKRNRIKEELFMFILYGFCLYNQNDFKNK